MRDLSERSIRFERNATIRPECGSSPSLFCAPLATAAPLLSDALTNKWAASIELDPIHSKIFLENLAATLPKPRHREP